MSRPAKWPPNVETQGNYPGVLIGDTGFERHRDGSCAKLAPLWDQPISELLSADELLTRHPLTVYGGAVSLIHQI